MSEWNQPGPSGIGKPMPSTKEYDKHRETAFLKQNNAVPHEHIVFINNVDNYNGKYLSHFFRNERFGKLHDGVYLKLNDGKSLASADVSFLPREEPTSLTSVSSFNSSEGNNNYMDEEKKSNESFDNNFPIKSDGLCSLQRGLNVSQLDESLPQKTSQSPTNLCSPSSEFKLQSQRSCPRKCSQDDFSFRLADNSNPQAKLESKRNDKYYVIGTTDSPKSAPEGIYEKVKKATEDPYHYDAAIKKSVTVIYDLSDNHLEVFEANMALQIMMEQCDGLIEQLEDKKSDCIPIRTFIMISPVVTWYTFDLMEGRKITEMDYDSRTTCPKKYGELMKFEYEVIHAGLKYPGLLRTFVICSGITYGYEQNLLSCYFKFAWGQSQYLPVFKHGNNKLPLIHIEDLCKIIYTVALQENKSGVYIFAIEPMLCSVVENLNALGSVALIDGLKHFGNKEKFLEEIPVKEGLMDILTSHMDFEPIYIKYRIHMTWRDGAPFISNIENLLREFISASNISALRIVILGPPGTGKTRVSKMVQELYRIPYLSAQIVIANFTQQLTILINEARSKVECNGRTDSNEPVPIISLEQFILLCFPYIERRVMNGTVTPKHLLMLEQGQMKLNEELAENNNWLRDETVGLMFRMYLNHPRALKQGYVIDGYPKTSYQASCIFPEHRLPSWVPRDDSKKLTGNLLACENKLYNCFPNMIVVLEAAEDIVMDEIMASLEKYDEHSVNVIYHMERRFTGYRKRKNSVFNVEQYFKHHKTLILKQNVAFKCRSRHMTVLKNISDVVGQPTRLISERGIEKYSTSYVKQNNHWQMPTKGLRNKNDEDDELEFYFPPTQIISDYSDNFSIAAQYFYEDISFRIMPLDRSEDGSDIEEELTMTGEVCHVCDSECDESCPKLIPPPAPAIYETYDPEDPFLTAPIKVDSTSVDDSPFHTTIYDPKTPTK